MMEVLCPRIEAKHVLTNDKLWAELPKYAGFKLADGSGPSQYHTEVQVCWDLESLYVSFCCDDQDVLSTYTKRDEPLYEQEVVEVFLAPSQPEQYFEFNVSPRNVVFDSIITNTLDGRGFAGDPRWDSPGLISVVQRTREPEHDLSLSDGFGPWIARLAIPFKDLEVAPPQPGAGWWINFYRIKRQPVEEYSCWSPTYRNPAFFHVPKHFSRLSFV